VSATTVSGVEGEERQDFTKEESTQIRQRSLKLLGSLLHPLRTRLWLTMIVVVVSTGAQVAGPALIAFGIDNGLPALLKQDWFPLAATGVAYLATGIAGAVLIAWYTVLSARISQAILIDLRKRVFLHTQRLSLEFHESYTSGRIISRQTSDLDSIRELLDSGINQLVQGFLYMLFIAIALFALDWQSGVVLLVCSALPAHTLVPVALPVAVPDHPGGVGEADCSVRRDHDGHSRGQGVSQREAQ
jgi:ATP-binding cassette subfamily B protein